MERRYWGGLINSLMIFKFIYGEFTTQTKKFH